MDRRSTVEGGGPELNMRGAGMSWTDTLTQACVSVDLPVHARDRARMHLRMHACTRTLMLARRVCAWSQKHHDTKKTSQTQTQL